MLKLAGYVAAFMFLVVALLMSPVWAAEPAKTTGSLTDCTVSTSDFTHRSDSTCRDAGTTVAAVSTDYIGTARPQNSVFDIGAYEYIVVSGGGMSETPSWSSPRKHHLWRR